jgi:TfoX/Sxy family transcriptional regulator of competence genes
MSNDLLIKINADAKNAEKAFDDIRKQSEDLEGQLNKVALVSGAAFAAFTAEIYFSVKAFEEANAASIQLNNSLQNQGIYTKKLSEEYKSFAVAVQAKTGIDDDAITKAQAVAQTFLGQTKITKDLSFAIADLGASMGGDLNAAAEKIARTIGTGTNAFARQGLKISESATEAERYAKVLEFVQAKAGGLAEEFNKADGYSKALTTAFGNLQEEIGGRFAPVVAAARKAAAGFFEVLSNNPVLVDIIASLIAAGVAVAGLATAIAIAVPAFLALKAAVIAFGVASNIAFAGIPIAIGLIVASLTFLALNWNTSLAYIKSISSGVVTFISELFSGLGQVLKGAFTLDVDKVIAGLQTIKGAYAKGKEDAVQTFQAVTAAQAEEGEKQDAAKKAQADKEAARERQHQANLRGIRQAEIELLRLQNENASATIIDLKTKEIEVLKALDQDKSNAELQLFRDRREIIKGLQDEQNAEDLERQAAFEQIKADAKAELDQKGIEVDTELRTAQLAQLQAQAQSEADIDRQVQSEIITRRTAARNQELLDRKKYGETVAIISKVLGSEEVKGAKSAADDLVQLQNSKNETLKTIGKAAAVANITIGTAESAMNIYRGFATIPIVGPALGIVGAAAAVAFGAERISQVTAAADGGLITGGVPGQDSVPALLMPGELVVPKKNFNDVVGAVQGNASSEDNSQMVDLLRSIDNKFSNPQQTVIQGDVMADDSFIDSLVKRISDAVEFRNAQIFGVTA